eukprot:Hpha_TRINITY_DN15983_c0_g2::TRINITY_DN15983_c0_g2_i1::g.70447::m.70447
MPNALPALGSPSSGGGEVQKLNSLITAIDSEEAKAKQELSKISANQKEIISKLKTKPEAPNLSRRSTMKRVSIAPSSRHGSIGPHSHRVQRGRASIVAVGFIAGRSGSEVLSEEDSPMIEMKEKLQAMEKESQLKESTWQSLLKKKGDQLVLVMRREQMVSTKLRARVTGLEEEIEALNKEMAELRDRHRELGGTVIAPRPNATGQHAQNAMLMGHQRVMELQRSQDDVVSALHRAVGTARNAFLASAAKRARERGGAAATGMSSIMPDSSPYSSMPSPGQDPVVLQDQLQKLYSLSTQMSQTMRQNLAKLRAQSIRFKQNIEEEMDNMMHTVASFGTAKRGKVVKFRSQGVQAGEWALEPKIDVVVKEGQEGGVVDAFRQTLQAAGTTLLPPCRDLVFVLDPAKDDDSEEGVPSVPELDDETDAKTAGQAVLTLFKDLARFLTQSTQDIHQSMRSLAAKDHPKPTPPQRPVQPGHEPPVSHEAFKQMMLWVKAQVDSQVAHDGGGGAEQTLKKAETERRAKLEQTLRWAQKIIQQGDRLKGEQSPRLPDLLPPRQVTNRSTKSKGSKGRGRRDQLAAARTPADSPEMNFSRNPTTSLSRELTRTTDLHDASEGISVPAGSGDSSEDDLYEDDTPAMGPRVPTFRPPGYVTQATSRVKARRRAPASATLLRRGSLPDKGVYCVLCGKGPHQGKSDGEPCDGCGAGLLVSMARQLLLRMRGRAASAGRGNLDRQRQDCLQQVLFEFNIWADGTRAAGYSIPSTMPVSPLRNRPPPLFFSKVDDMSLRTLCKETLMLGEVSNGPLLNDDFPKLIGPPSPRSLRPLPIRPQVPERPPTNQVTRMLRDFCQKPPEGPVSLPPLPPSAPRDTDQAAPRRQTEPTTNPLHLPPVGAGAAGP